MGKLTAAKIKSIAKPGMYGDGGTLYLSIAPGGSKMNETISVNINIAGLPEDPGTLCAGIGTPVMTVTQTPEPVPIYIGGLIEADQLATITSFEEFNSSLGAGVHAAFQAVYQ